ncbi:MAG: myxococcus cysteine-rich repeat containing protein [Myxococcota bacterium]
MAARLGALATFVLGVTAGAAGACGEGDAFSCRSDAQCDLAGGRCEENARCSFPDAECDSGYAYGDHAGAVSGQCVPLSPVAADGQGHEDSGADEESETGDAMREPSLGTTGGPDDEPDGSSGDPEPDPPFCGDGQVDTAEQCDDGNTVSGDGCNTDCRVSGERVFELAFDYEADRDEVLRAITVLPDGDVIVAGKTSSGGAPGTDMLVARHDPSGRRLWDHRYDHGLAGGYDEAWSVDATGDGRVMAAGTSSLAEDDGDRSIKVIVLDAVSGGIDPQCCYTGNTASNDVLYDLALRPDDEPVIVGARGSGRHGFARHYLAEGYQFHWTAQLQPASPDGDVVYYAVAIDPEGNAVATGSERVGDEEIFLLDVYAAEPDAAGDPQLLYQVRDIGDSTSDRGRGIAIASDGTVHVAGLSSTGYGPRATVFAFDETLEPQWEQVIDVDRPAIAESIAVDDGGGVAVVGNYELPGGAAQGFVTKLGPVDHEVVWSRDTGASASKLYGVALDAQGNVLTCGFADDGSGDRAAALAKYTP